MGINSSSTSIEGEEGSIQDLPQDNLDAWIQVTGGVKKGWVIGFSPRESSTRLIQSVQSSQSVNQLSSPNEFQLTQFKDMLKEAMPDILKDCFENYALSMGWKPLSPRILNIVSIISYFAFSCYTILSY